MSGLLSKSRFWKALTDVGKETEKKHFWLSKTFWVNIIIIAGMVAQEATGKEWINLETQAIILGVLNLILRKITKKPVNW